MMEGFPGRAAPSMEKPVCVPLVSGILRIAQWSQSVLPPTTRRKVPSHVLQDDNSQVAAHRQVDRFEPETLTPSLDICLLRRIQARENSSV